MAKLRRREVQNTAELRPAYVSFHKSERELHVCVCTAAQDCASLRLLGTFNSAVSVSLSLSFSFSFCFCHGRCVLKEIKTTARNKRRAVTGTLAYYMCV